MSDIPFPKIYMREHLNAVAKTLKEVSNNQIHAAAVILKSARDSNSRVFLCGNGGSAATASHFANDLMKMAGVQAICLNDMTSTMLAYMNDDGVENMFLSPLKNFGDNRRFGERWHDVLLAISCSGNSPNIVACAEHAEKVKAHTIALTGDTGGKLAKIASFAIRVPHPDIKVQEDVHLAITHALAGVLAQKWD